MSVVVEIILHTVSALFFFLCGYVMFEPDVWFPYHPFFMMMGYGMMFGGSILFSKYIKSRKRKWWLQFHLIAMLIGYSFVTFAFYVIVDNKISRGKLHFQSWHACLGLLAYSLTTIQITFGLVIYYLRKRLTKAVGVSTTVKICRFHKWSGLISHGIAMVTLAFGFASNFSLNLFGYEISMVLAGISLLITLCVLLFEPDRKPTSSPRTTETEIGV